MADTPAGTAGAPKPKKPRKLRLLRRWSLYYVLQFILSAIRRMPVDVATGIGSLLGGLMFWINRVEQRRAIRHLTGAFGKEKSPAEIRRIAQTVFRNFGRNAFEYVHAPLMTSDELAQRVYRFDGRQHLQKAMDAGTGALVATAHTGGWEFVAAYWVSLGWEVVVVARRIYFEPFNRLIETQRESVGVKTIYQDQGVRPLLRALRRGAIVGLLADQDIPRIDGVFVDLFGRPAYTPVGPFSLALATGAPFLPTFNACNGSHGNYISVGAPLEIERTDDRQRDAVTLAQAWSDQFEAFVRRNPDQWPWFHRRWRTRPEHERRDAQKSSS